MRRLPIYFLIDVSESMVGDPIEQVQAGMAAIIKELKTDPYALETVYLSIIAFAGKAQKITPLMEIINFYPPKLPIGGGTSLGNALNFLMNDLDASIQKTTYEEKGNWNPIIFLFTDGNPTDDVNSAFDRWNQKYRKAANLIAISLGNNTDTNILGRITDDILLLKNTDEESFSRFFKWITASIKTSSVAVTESNNTGLSLAPVTEGLTKIEPNKQSPAKIDENFAVILAKCQTTKRLYLIKYQKYLSESNYVGMKVLGYKLAGAYPIDNTYFELADDKQSSQTVNTDSLDGFPSCPCCGNQYGFSHCACGNILCTGGEEITTCPWCGSQAKFGFSDGSANITRTRG
ncbi:MAG: VWA domain-containing protein [Prevotellaceae bacterium]|jgi:uncharacterized protein YegL|nr:VWA domain-containing protein [Prevotellaceae bacterium]